MRFKVVGAGELILSNKANVKCGKATGFGIGVTWGKYDETGGVLDRKEAEKLANFILAEVYSYE